MNKQELKDQFIRKMLQLLFDKGEDLEFIETIDDAKMMGFDDLAEQFIGQLNETEKFIYQLRHSELNKNFSAN